MKGYVYITGQGTDPGLGHHLKDPLFTKVPTLGACMPNIRRFVTKGDWIFVVSGKAHGVQQYVVGGLQVEEKIDALTAFERFPENRLSHDERGVLTGNVIVQADGGQHPLDTHAPSSFDRRINDFIVGGSAIELNTPQEIEIGRQQTFGKLSDILGRPGANRLINVMGRCSKLDEKQVVKVLDWLSGIKSAN